MSTQCHHLFVYGSLRRGFHHPAYQYISDYFRFVSNARVKGALYDMGEFPAAIPVEKDAYILGELYELIHPEQFGWAFAQLDDYEGIQVEEGEQAYYRRDLVEVFQEQAPVQAWIYWYNAPIGQAPQILSGDVLQYRDSKNQ